MKITIDRSVVEQALEFIRAMNQHGWMLADYEDDAKRVVEDLAAALADPQGDQQPAGIVIGFNGEGHAIVEHDGFTLEEGSVLYLAPPHRKPLTDEQKQTIHNETGAGHSLICLVESYINGIKE